MHNISEVLNVMSSRLESAPMQLNADGQVELDFGSDFLAHVTRIDDKTIELSARLANLDFTSPAMMAAMLAANFLGQGTGFGRLACDPAKLEVIYCERWDISDMSAEGVARRTGDFLKVAAYWFTEGTDLLVGEAHRLGDPDPSSETGLVHSEFDDGLYGGAVRA